MMSRYASHLSQLPDVYKYAFSCDVSKLAYDLSKFRDKRIVFIGSGQSHITGLFIKSSLRRNWGTHVECMTPMMFLMEEKLNCNTAYWIITVGGANSDCSVAMDKLAGSEPGFVGLLSCTDGPLSHQSRGCGYGVHLFPGLKWNDGFLGSIYGMLLAVVALRAVWERPPEIFGVPAPNIDCVSVEGDFSVSPVWKDTVLVLYSPEFVATAAAIENLFSEAALGSVTLCDFKNFCHGRHFWITSRRESTTVIAVIGYDCQSFYKRLHEIAFQNTNVYRITIKDSEMLGQIASLETAYNLVLKASATLDYDITAPPTMDLGSRLHNALSLSEFLN